MNPASSTASRSPATNKLLAIVGPTGVGKSEVGYLLAQRLEAEIISADSMQVYQGMDIGTAKPSFDCRQKVTHHLIDVVSVDHDFTVAGYQKLAREKITEIQGKGKLPLLVGGSGLYVRAVVDDLSFPPQEQAQNIREDLQRRAEEEEGESLFEELKRVDPESAKRVDPHNIRRVIRALEVYKLTGQPFSAYQKRWDRRESIYDLTMVGIALPRPLLYKRLDERVDKMLERGLLKEVKGLVERGYRSTLTAKQALGYKELVAFLDGVVSYKKAVQKMKQNTRHFAKRQLTWFRRDPRVAWFERKENEDAKALADRIESYITTKLSDVG